MAGRTVYDFDYDDFDYEYDTNPRKTEVQYSKKKVAVDKQKSKKTNIKTSTKSKTNVKTKQTANTKSAKKTTKSNAVKKQPKTQKKTTAKSTTQKKKATVSTKSNGQSNTKNVRNSKNIEKTKSVRSSEPKLQAKQQPSISPELERKFWKRAKAIMGMAVVFLVILSIGYRNAQIDEGFMRVEKLKSQLSELKKENEQLAVSIENNLNLSNVEEIAGEILGMRKLDNSQKVYINLPKRDYIEPATEKVVIEETSFLDKILKILQNLW